jgi:hypothetical protein
MAAGAAVLALIFFACPLIMMAHAQMTYMMDQEMPSQEMVAMCPMLCGIPTAPAGAESGQSVLGPVSAHLDPNPPSEARPIFHPPTLA